MSDHSTEPLWRPAADPAVPLQIDTFRQFVNQRHSLSLADSAALHAWSIGDTEAFWVAIWDHCGVVAETRGERVVVDPQAMPGARWFPDARLNFADNLLRRRDDTIAIRFRGEDGAERQLSYAQLARRVSAVAAMLRREGVEPGDRVAGFMPNIPETIVAMLASASVGAVWSSCSPDFGVNGVLDRFGQITPKVLFTADGYRYNGRVHDSLAVVSEMAPTLDGLRRIVVVEHVGEGELRGMAAEMAVGYASVAQPETSAVAGGAQAEADAGMAAADAAPAEAGGRVPLGTPLPFDHPLYIMFSSGTTGQPKCIVHGAGGTLLQHLKEHRLHCDVRPGDPLFYFTTCGWMMWNWLVSGLASEATLMLFDGSPFHPDGNVLFDYAEEAGCAIFGTSAKFIDACSKAGIEPAKTHSLPALRSILSTGSPLVPESFDYVYEKIGSDLCLSSMSGGTDIVSCFALGNPAQPVYRGELQSLGLGLDVRAFDASGNTLPVGEKGELVCVKPFPCMPVGFFNDPDGKRYHEAYFDRFDNVWCHGDYVAITEHGGMIIYGRSDAVLNPGGVRIGTAEIYRQVEQFDEVVESLVIGQQWKGDVRVVLFVRLRDGLDLDDDLIDRLRKHIRAETTPRHVPAKVLQVNDIPRTRSGKIVELAVRRIVHGEPVDNVEALANPDALDEYQDLPALAE